MVDRRCNERKSRFRSQDVVACFVESAQRPAEERQALMASPDPSLIRKSPTDCLLPHVIADALQMQPFSQFQPTAVWPDNEA